MTFLQEAAHGDQTQAMSFLKTLFDMWESEQDNIAANGPWHLKTWTLAMISILSKGLDFAYASANSVSNG